MISAYDADVAICSDGGFVRWRDSALARDIRFPVIIANHGVSEIPGMVILAEHLKSVYPGLKVVALPQEASYELVGAR